MPRILVRWLADQGTFVRLLVVSTWAFAVIAAVYLPLRWAFGPYRHWTLWVRVPIAALLGYCFVLLCVVGPALGIWRRWKGGE